MYNKGNDPPRNVKPMPIHDWSHTHPGIFHHFHHEWISTIARALNSGLLPPEYYALAEQIAGDFGPDVLALRAPGMALHPTNGHDSFDENTARGSGVVTASEPKVRFTASIESDRYARKRNQIAVRHTSGDEVIAVLEIVSPGNKSSQFAMRSFVDKAIRLLDAGVHLLILDLLPPGPRDPQGIHGAIWSEMSDENDFRLPPDDPLTLVAYAANEVKQAFIEPVAVGEVLPDMPVFLMPPRHVPVPLEATYQSAFEAVPKRWQDEILKA